MQPVWLCILPAKRFEDTFKGTQWWKAKQMRPVWLCVNSRWHFEDSFKNTLWSRTNAISVSLHPHHHRNHHHNHPEMYFPCCKIVGFLRSMATPDTLDQPGCSRDLSEDYDGIMMMMPRNCWFSTHRKYIFFLSWNISLTLVKKLTNDREKQVDIKNYFENLLKCFCRCFCWTFKAKPEPRIPWI